MKSSIRKNVSTIIMVVLAITVIALASALAVIPSAQYNAGVSQGVKTGESKQLEVIKSDRHKGIVPNLVGQNANQAGYWTFGGLMRIEVNNAVTLEAKFIAPNGVEISQDNAKNYKVVSQEPKAGTIFDVQYEDCGGGKECDNVTKSTGISGIRLTLEKIKE